MGGVFSTRWNGHRRRRTVESCRTLDLNLFIREARRSARGASLLEASLKGDLTYKNGDRIALELEWETVRVPATGDRFEGGLFLVYPWRRYENGVEVEALEETLLVPVSLSALASGGQRLYLHCPLKRRDGSACLARVSRLYLPRGGQLFGCRTCHNLTYESVRTHDKRVDRIVRDLEAGRHERYAHDLRNGSGLGDNLTQLGLYLTALKKLEDKERRK